MSLSQSTTLPTSPTPKWIPPHRRTSGSVPNLPPPMLSDSGKMGAYTRADLAYVFNDRSEGTLCHSHTDRAKISRILIFDQQHPNFPPEIFVKSNLDLVLDGPMADLLAQEFPVFFQALESKNDREGKWIFKGWWKVEHVRKLAAWSPELVEYAETKWKKLDVANPGAGERTGSRWNKSLGVNWAVVEITKVRDGDDPVKRWFERFEIKRSNASETPSTIERATTPPFTNVRHPSSRSPIQHAKPLPHNLPPAPSDIDLQLDESIVSIGNMGIDSASEFDGEEAVISRSDVDEGEWDKLSVTTEGGAVPPVKGDGGGAWTVLYAERDEVV